MLLFIWMLFVPSYIKILSLFLSLLDDRMNTRWWYTYCTQSFIWWILYNKNIVTFCPFPSFLTYSLNINHHRYLIQWSTEHIYLCWFKNNEYLKEREEDQQSCYLEASEMGSVVANSICWCLLYFKI